MSLQKINEGAMWLAKKYDEGFLYHPEIQAFAERLFNLPGWDQVREIKGNVDPLEEKKWAKPYLPNIRKLKEKDVRPCEAVL